VNVPGLDFDPDAPGLAWRETREPGVSWIPLFLAEDVGGRKAAPRADAHAHDGADATVLIRMEPGHGYPAHRHVGVEEVLVLHGGYRDADGRYERGDYVRYPAGSLHAPVALGDRTRPSGQDNPACVLFAVARGGVELQRD
jgi:anti-sigma factor ChrR (cupin superfamily)